MGALVSTDVTVTQVNPDRHIFGSERMNFATIAFGGAAKTYPFGGIPMPTVARLGLAKGIDEIMVSSPDADGIEWRYDKTNHTLKAFIKAPPIVFQEVVDCSDDLAYTKYPAAFIMYVASADTYHKVVSGLCTPATGQVAVDLYSATPGTRAKLTFPANEGAAVTYVTYVTQAWKEVFDNLVENEEINVTTNNYAVGTPDTFDLVNQACAIQNVTWKDATVVKACSPMIAAVTTLGTTELAVDFINSAKTTLSVLTTDDWQVTISGGTGADHVYVTYIKKPASGFLYDRLVDQEDLTPSSDIITLASSAIDNALLYGTMGAFAGGATTKQVWLVASSASLSTTATIIKQTAGKVLGGISVANTFTMGSNHSDSDHVYPAYIYGYPEEIQSLVPLEMPNGTLIPRAKTLRLMIWGK